MKRGNSNHLMIRGTAHAKLNLTLHVTGRLSNGYHELDSLVVFTEFGDHLALEPAHKFHLKTKGPFSKALPPVSKNIILSTLCHFEGQGTDFKVSLEKSIPVSAGLGGGSTNASTVLHLAANYLGYSLPVDVETLVAIGSDLPVCFSGKPAIVRGLGEKLTILDRFYEFPVLLVNPNKPVQTREVYHQLSEVNNPPQTPYPVQGNKGEVLAWLKEQRNDLESPAIMLCPEIKSILSVLRDQEGWLLARMSGSGGTCFGIFQTMEQAAGAARKIKQHTPEWWVQPTRILPH